LSGSVWAATLVFLLDTGRAALLTGTCRCRRNVLEDLAAFHHERDARHGGDIGERVAVERDEVCLVAGRERADRLVEIE